MPTEAKAKTIEETREKYGRAVGVVFTDYRGLKVKEMQALRAKLREKGAELDVVKNTLFRIAAGDDAAKLTEDLSNGPTAVAFLFENESEGAKALVDYANLNKKFKIKGGFFSGRSISQVEVEALSTLPPRDVLISQVIGAIAAPLTNLVSTIEALYADPIRVIGAVADKVAEGSAPVAEAPVADAPVEEAPEAPVEVAAAEPAPEPESNPVEAPAETPAPESETQETE